MGCLADWRLGDIVRKINCNIGGLLTQVKKDFALDIGVGFVDADGSTTAKEFFRLFQVAKSFDGVIASRLLPGSQVYGRSFWRQTVSRLFKVFRNLIIFLPFADTQCGAKIFKKEVIINILPSLTIADMAFDVQLLAHMYRNKHLIREEPSIWVHTGNSATFNSPLALIKTAWKMVVSIYKIKNK